MQRFHLVDCHYVDDPYLSNLIFCLFQNTNFTEPVRIFSEEEKNALGLKYYDEDVHRAAFILPRFTKQVSVNNIISFIIDPQTK